jgi:hypothetical protein
VCRPRRVRAHHRSRGRPWKGKKEPPSLLPARRPVSMSTSSVLPDSLPRSRGGQIRARRHHDMAGSGISARYLSSRRAAPAARRHGKPASSSSEYPPIRRPAPLSRPALNFSQAAARLGERTELTSESPQERRGEAHAEWEERGERGHVNGDLICRFMSTPLLASLL